MPTFNKKKSFMMRSGNSPMFKHIGSSPVLRNGKKQKIKGSNINITGKNIDVQKIEEKEIKKKTQAKKETETKKETVETKPVTPPKKDKPKPPTKDKPKPPKKDKEKVTTDKPTKGGMEKDDPAKDLFGPGIDIPGKGRKFPLV